MTENTKQANTEIVRDETQKQEEITRSPERYNVPPVDIYEDKDGLVVTADLPGAHQESINVNVEQNILTIRAESIVKPAEGENALQEFEIGTFYRQFKLGDTIDRDRIDANYRNGVLTLRLPFAEAARPKKISVSVT